MKKAWLRTCCTWRSRNILKHRPPVRVSPCRFPCGRNMCSTTTPRSMRLSRARKPLHSMCFRFQHRTATRARCIWLSRSERRFRHLRIHQWEDDYSSWQGIPGDDQFAHLRPAVGAQRILEADWWNHHAAWNESGGRPLCSGFVLHQRDSENSGRSRGRCQRVLCDSQRLGAAGNLYTGTTEYFVHDLADSFRPQESPLLF